MNPPNADMSKYYKYHRNNGRTDEWKALQDKIEELFRASHFRRFVKKDGPSNLDNLIYATPAQYSI